MLNWQRGRVLFSGSETAYGRLGLLPADYRHVAASSSPSMLKPTSGGGVIGVGGEGEFVSGVLAAPLDVLGQARGNSGEVERVDHPALGLQLASHVGDVECVVEDHQVGQQRGEERSPAAGRHFPR
ncbi:hypothetical protein ACE1SV_64170 [Streptomyces sennicomposti]